MVGSAGTTSTTGNDLFTASVSATAADNTFSLLDTINGGAGSDTFNILVAVAAADVSVPTAVVSNIETLNIRAISTDGVISHAATVAAPTGATTINNDRGTESVTVTAMAAGATIGVIGDGVVSHATTTFAYNTAGAASIAISGGTKAGNITNSGASSASNTVTSTGAANTVGIIDLGTGTNATSLTINAATNLTASLAADYAATAAVTVAGAATLVNLSGAALSANIAKVDASGLTAGGVSVLVDQTNATVDTQFIGGAGNDTLDVGVVVYSSTTLTAVGGAGTDTIKMSDAAALTSTTAKYITGFETLSLTDDNDGALDTFDASLLSGITAITIAADSAADGYAVTNISAAQALAVTISGTQAVAPTLTLKDATSVGNLDTLTVAINDGASTTGTITLADLTAAGTETINFALTDNLTVTAATGLTAATKITATGAGALSFTSGALALNGNSTIDASALTGTATINVSGGTGNGILIKGSATKANIITGTNQNDVIVGGTGVDTVLNQADAATDSDTVDFVSDSAADIFEITTLTGRSTIANFDVATATTTEDLVNVSANAADGAEVQITAAAGAAAIGTDRTIVIEQAVGTAAALATGGTATLAAADFTAATLTNLAAYLSERFTHTGDTNANDSTAMIFLNNGTNTYAYYFADSTTNNTTVDANELILVGVFTGAVLNAGDVYQTV